MEWLEGGRMDGMECSCLFALFIHSACCKTPIMTITTTTTISPPLWLSRFPILFGKTWYEYKGLTQSTHCTLLCSTLILSALLYSSPPIPIPLDFHHHHHRHHHHHHDVPRTQH